MIKFQNIKAFYEKNIECKMYNGYVTKIERYIIKITN